MAKAAGKTGATAAKARATKKPTAAAARKSRRQSKADDLPDAAPAIAVSSGAVGAENEPFAPASLDDGDEQPDEEALLADVSSIIDPLVMLEEHTSEDTPAQAPMPLPAPSSSPEPSSSMPTIMPTTVAAAAAASSESAIQAAQLMARQHAEYQRSVELVRQQLAHRHMQQMQHTQQQHLQLQMQQQHMYQQGQQAASAAAAGGSPAVTSASVMHQIQQRIQERIQQKQLYDQIHHQGSTPDAAAAQQQQQLQIQQYHAMIRELEMQASAAAVAAAAAASSPTPSSAGMSQEELERMRQDRLQRLHHMQLQNMQHQQMHMQAQQQHAAALRVTLTGVPPADQQQPIQQMHVDLDRLRQLHEQQQQRSQETHAAVQESLAQNGKPPTPKAAKVSAKKRAADQVSAVNDSKPGVVLAPAPPTTATSSSTPDATAVAPPKKKRKTPAESQMEALVRVLCRLQLSKNESEMRNQLEKLAAWINKSGDVCLLRFALRDFVEVFGAKQKQFDKSPLWPTDLLPKCTFTHDKLRHAISALQQATAVAADKLKASPTPTPTTTANQDSGSSVVPTAQPATTPVENVSTPSTVSTAKPSLKAATTTTAASDAITLAAREHAYAALKEQMLAQLLQPKPRATPAANKVVNTNAGATSATTAAPSTATGGDAGDGSRPDLKETIKSGVDGKGLSQKKKKRDLSIDVHVGAAPTAVKTTAVGGGPTPLSSTPTSMAATASRPPLPSLPPPAHPVPSPTPTPASTVISPQVAQHLFDLELAPRSCAMTQEEGEERFYFPVKHISNIMRRILPGGGPATVRRRRKKRRTATDNETANGDGDVTAAAKKKQDDDEEDDDGDDDGEGEGGADEGEENEAKYADDDEGESKGELGITPAASQGVLPGAAVTASAFDEEPVKIDDNALTFMQECVTEFLLFFTSEARDHSAYERKKGSISGLNLIHALDNLGYSPYAKVLANYNDKVRKVQDEAAQQKQERKNLAKQRKLQAEKELLKQHEQAQETKPAPAVEALQLKTELLAQVRTETAAAAAVTPQR